MAAGGIVTDTGTLIREWCVSPSRVEQIAADLAAKIDTGQIHRWAELPALAVLSDEYDVTERTISSAKSLLAAHGFLTLENRRYYVA
jgi:DNA-binding GntR family transcriptional regulator